MKTVVLFSALMCTFFLALVAAQQPTLRLTATSVNVSEPGNVVRIDLHRWSADNESEQLLTAMTPPTAPPTPAASAVPAVPAASAAPAVQSRDDDAGPARGTAGRGAGGRGAGQGNRGGRGARGGGGGAAPLDPIAALTNALGKAQTIGYIWTNEVTGYSIKYARRLPSPDGGERIILATNRRIGGHTLSWKPLDGSPTNYEFTFVEIRLNSKGSGEGKSSLTTAVAIDREGKTIGLENYASAPALLANVKHP